MDIRGFSAVVSGGASGLGAATARKIVEAGGLVTILDRDGEKAKALASELGGGTEYVVADVSDENEVQAAIDVALGHGPLRAVINCAGIGIAERTIGRDGTPHSLAAFERIIKVNLIGTFNLLRLGASAINKSEPLEFGERGVIINTASIAAYDGQIGQLAYSASKGAIVGMTLPAARDLSAAGIRVVTIAPGIMDTPLLGQLPDQIREMLASGVPFPHRLGVPDDFASMAMEIIRNGYLNGEVVRLDGALRMPPK
ncbi:MAG: SDR family NAD(P)-dependent oxidoreductase [Actinomycetota bacterium]|nr:SDR family NAD(P)-dependent oxidoreductase [Actinomycetota bacterium]